jgi:hypothetical protein
MSPDLLQAIQHGNLVLNPEGRASPEWTEWVGAMAYKQTGMMPSRLKQHGSSTVCNNVRSNTFNSVTAMKLKTGLKIQKGT